MDWRDNKYVGMAAVVALVIFIGVIGWRTIGGTSDPTVELLDGMPAMKFECDTCEGRFEVPMREIAREDVYLSYMVEYGSATPCRLCGEDTAYRAYFCPECDQWYRYTRAQGSAAMIFCPERHEIPMEHQ